MSDKKNIDRLFQEKFKDFEAVPDNNVWKGIEARLQNKKKRRVLPMWWTLGGVAAALLLMFAVANGFFNDASVKVIPTIVEIEKDIINTEDKTNTNSEQNTEMTKSVASQNKEEVQQTTDVVDKNNETLSNSVSSVATKITKKASENSIVSTSMEDKNAVTNSKLNSTKTINSAVVSDNKKEEVALKSESEINQLLKSEKENTTVSNATKINKTTENAIEDKKTVEELTEQEQTIDEAIAEAKSLSEKEKEDGLLNRWSVSPNVAPVYFNSLGEGSAIDAQFNNNATRSDVTMSYGVKGSYAVSKRLRITTGVNRVSFNNSTSDVIALSDNSFAARSSSASGQLKNVTLNGTVSSASLMVMSRSSLSRSAIPEAINTLATGDLEQRFGFIEIPLEVEYRVIDKKIGFNVSGGFSTLFLNENEIFADVNGESSLIGEANNISDTSFSANFGLGVDYNISKKVNINLEPKFKYQLNTFNNTSGDFQPFFIGVYTGLSFKF